MIRFIDILASFVAVIVVVTLHEFAHAFVANKCGDPTAKMEGRMSLNPVKHFDLVGILAFVFLHFGWAKPVPVNPYNFKNYKKGAFWTSAAGIITNYLTAFLFYPLFLIVIRFLLPLPAFQGTVAAYFLQYTFYYLVAYSLNFAVFNLLPFYPLDGFRMWDALDQKKGKVYRFFRQYGYYILLGLMLLSMLAQYVPVLEYVNILGYLQYFGISILGKPITLFWNWIF